MKGEKGKGKQEGGEEGEESIREEEKINLKGAGMERKTKGTRDKYLYKIPVMCTSVFLKHKFQEVVFLSLNHLLPHLSARFKMIVISYLLLDSPSYTALVLK